MTTATVVVEKLDGAGRVLGRDRIVLREAKRTFTIGRSVLADVHLDDPYAAALHAAIELTPDGRLLVSDLGSVNGIVVGGNRQHKLESEPVANQVLQIGRTRLKLRTNNEDIAPEKQDTQRTAWRPQSYAVTAMVAGAAIVAQLVYASWYTAPRDLVATMAYSLAMPAVIAAAWVAVWGLLTRVMQGEWRWLRHLTIYLGGLALYTALGSILQFGRFVFSSSSWLGVDIWLGLAALGVVLYLHLRGASSLTGRHAATVACVIPLLIGSTGHWFYFRNMMRDVNHIGAHMPIYPSALRLSAAEPLDKYFARSATLRQLADRKLKAALAADPDDEGD
jgi:pSer/pThr/pTyr-binding forkhead associated (FHA) protein